MGLREDVKFVVKQDYEPKVPSEDIILQQAINVVSRGKSTRNVALDRKAIKAMEKLKSKGEDR